MIRRRRPQREIAFSFDSFLDVVANVVGIILRLILVAWVGARSYKAFVPPPPPPSAAIEEEVVSVVPDPTDPLTAELPRHQLELEKAHARLQEQMRTAEEIDRQASVVAGELPALIARRQKLEAERAVAAPAAERAATAPAAGGKGQEMRAAAVTLAEMEERARKVRAELEAVNKAPLAKQTLRYRTPLSKPLQTDELLFECRQGRVTLIDVGSLLEEARQRMRDKSEMLRHQWEVRDETNPVGAFRLSFVVERERSALEQAANGAAPDDRTTFHYGIGSWLVVPLDPNRGETAERALAPGSAFRRVLDAIDTNQTAVTFWVYPDSFATYRKLRDALHDRDIVVALPSAAGRLSHLGQLETRHGFARSVVSSQ